MLENVKIALLKALCDHIGTKTVDEDYHEFLDEVMHLYFDIIHYVGEKYEDIGAWEYTVEDLQACKNSTYDTLEKIKILLDDNSENYSKGTEHLFWKYLDRLECICGTARWYAKEEELEEEENETPEEEAKEEIAPKIDSKIKLPYLPR